ncbi:MAG: acyltransferase [Thermoguttaceae bacterium]|jgi:acetyltransferase-like isoleucine patch superfamily enzyme
MICRKLDVIWAWFVRVTTNWMPDSPFFQRFRGRLYSIAMGKCGKRFQVPSDVRFSRLRNLFVGDDVWLGPNCVFLLRDPIVIEDEAIIGHKVMITSTNHTSVNGSYRYGKGKSAPITIKRGSWIGSHVVVLPGVTVGRGTVVGANSVVNRSLPDYCVCAGLPAVVKKELEAPEGETRQSYETIRAVSHDDETKSE